MRCVGSHSSLIAFVSFSNVREANLSKYKLLIRARPRRRRVRPRARQDARMLAMMALVPEVPLVL